MSFVEKKRTKFLALPICFTTYTLSDEKVTIRSGFLSITEDDAYMYKIQDVRLKKSLLERIFKIGTVICYTGDTTHPELVLTHIKHAAEIKEYILTASEEARRKRRTMHTLDIDAVEFDSE
ncbi:PH domain-containing protein [Anaerosporobacter sp.]|uniref:PH domain-containing protein n=1 Tax=Anaerosporobacter sp. TaxID=1872529 RepID=UPI00286EC0F7|nr:PH domain-containing protein [Anaerosporobacter sp.]